MLRLVALKGVARALRTAHVEQNKKCRSDMQKRPNGKELREIAERIARNHRNWGDGSGGVGLSFVLGALDNGALVSDVAGDSDKRNRTAVFAMFCG